MDKKMVYYAHSRREYGTLQEKHILNTIRGKFSDKTVWNPGSVSNQRNFKRVLTPGLSVAEYMKHFFRVIDKCEILVFSSLEDGKLGKGTTEEIFYAFTKKLPVFYIKLPNFCMEITSDMVIRLHESPGKSGWAENYGEVLIK